MIKPIININGTDAHELIEFRILAKRNIETVIDMLKAVTPNGRDYPGDAEACAADRALHYTRIGKLRDLQDALLEEATAIKMQLDLAHPRGIL